MGIPGVAPKPDDERERRNAPRINKVYAEWDGKIRGPELMDGVQWCDETKAWWEDWRTSPQSMLMGKSDWWIMQEAALLHNYIWTKDINTAPTSVAGAMRELRAKLAAFGATIEDRQKLRMQFKTPLDEANEREFVEQEVIEMVDYVEMLTSAVADKLEQNKQ